MRLIDADALKKTFCAECSHTIKCEDCDINYHFENLAPEIKIKVETRSGYNPHDITECEIYPTIDAVPKDFVEVVRCKDCFIKEACKVREFYGDNGYCSRGMTRKEEKT